MPDSKYYLALCTGCGWLAGVWLGSQLAPLLWPWLLIASLATLSAVLWWRVGRVGLILATLAAVAFGAARMVSSLPPTDQASAQAFHDTGDIVAYGLVSAEPEVRDTHVQLRVALTEIVTDNQGTVVKDTVLVRAPRYPEVTYGSTVRLVGELQGPETTSSAEYAIYLARQGIRSEMSYPQLVVLSTEGGSRFFHALLAVKARARAAIIQSIPEPQASLLVGILLGDDSGMSRTVADAFRRTGMTHIIAISGFNIALIIALADRLTLPFLPRRSAALVVMAFIAAYTALVGGSASVLRAALMGGVYLLSMRFLGRPTLALASLLLTAVVMTAVDPNALWDIGFQLSFAATLGLMLYAGPWTRWLKQRAGHVFDPDAGRVVTRLLAEGLVVTAAAQVLALPLILYYFGQLSLVSMPANLLILPAQPAVMMTGGVTALAGIASPLLGQAVGWVSWVFLAYTSGVVELLASVPGASVSAPLGIVGLLALFVTIGAATVAVKQPGVVQRSVAATARRGGRLPLLGGSLILAVLAGLWATTQPDGLLHVAFLDVGQGDAILVETPAGRQVLVDGGRYPTAVLDQLGRHIPFWDRTIDIVIATHPDEDHIAGLVSVLERYQVEMLLTNGDPSANDPTYRALLETAIRQGTNLHEVAQGEVFQLDAGTVLTILHPAADYQADGANSRSIVARLTYGDLSVLLTGDAEEDAERSLLAQQVPLASTVLKAGHHGSNGSSGEAFLSAVRPQVAIISAGRDNTFGHPHPDVLVRLEAVGATILRTDEAGTLELMSDGRKMWWQGRQ